MQKKTKTKTLYLGDRDLQNINIKHFPLHNLKFDFLHHPAITQEHGGNSIPVTAGNSLKEF